MAAMIFMQEEILKATNQTWLPVTVSCGICLVLVAEV